MNKILLTGFNPFNKEDINPSYEAVKKVKDNIYNYRIVKKELPTEYKKSIEVLDRTIEEIDPKIVILVGQAGGRASISLERIGINLRDGKIEDNSGYLAKEEKIKEDGEDGYFSNLPLVNIEKRLKENNIPTYISNTAGSFVCNNLLYSLMYKIREENKNLLGGFIHVPFIPEQVRNKPSQPSMDLDTIVLGLELIIEETIKHIGKTMKIKFYSENIDDNLKFVVIASRYRDKWIYVKHKERATYEMAGGHIEKGESAEEAAKRELYEETGAIKFNINRIGNYSVIVEGEDSKGGLFFAEIEELDKLPEFEIEKIKLSDDLMDLEKVTYPYIYPTLYKEILEYLR